MTTEADKPRNEMNLPPLPKLPEPDLLWWPAMTEDYQRALRLWARTYAEQYGLLCAEAEREACAANVDAMSELFIAAAELDRLQARVAELEVDAERYRWLRDTANGMPDAAEFWPAVRLDLPRAQDDAWCFNSASDIGLDAAIDTARKAKP